MVHHHVGDGSDAVVAERLDERAQFGLVSYEDGRRDTRLHSFGGSFHDGLVLALGKRDALMVGLGALEHGFHQSHKSSSA